MSVKPIRNTTLFALFLCSLLLSISCSSNKIRELSTLELAQQLVREQLNSADYQEKSPIKIHFIQPEKAVIGKVMDLEFELVSQKAQPRLTIVFEADEGLEFKNRWYFLKQESITRELVDVQADTIYHDKLSLKPVADGLLKLNIYVLYEHNKDKRAHLQTITFSIGDALSNERTKRITL